MDAEVHKHAPVSVQKIFKETNGKLDNIELSIIKLRGVVNTKFKDFKQLIDYLKHVAIAYNIDQDLSLYELPSIMERLCA